MTEGSFKYQKYMIKSAPYGQLDHVIQNLKKISPLDLETSQAQNTLRDYNEDHLALLKRHNKQTHYPISLISRNQQGHYQDQLNQKSYQINHLTREIEHQQNLDVQLPYTIKPLLNILSKKIHNYVDKYYRQTFGSQVFIEITQEAQVNVHVIFTTKNLQLSNYFTGEWTSQWIITKTNISGKVTIRSHIFQSGNVQMNHDRTYNSSFQLSNDMQENANKIIKVIESFECGVQKSLGEVYEGMSDNFFKHLRRIMPVTKSKMIWNVNALKMNKNLLQNKK